MLVLALPCLFLLWSCGLASSHVLARLLVPAGTRASWFAAGTGADGGVVVACCLVGQLDRAHQAARYTPATPRHSPTHSLTHSTLGAPAAAPLLLASCSCLHLMPSPHEARADITQRQRCLYLCVCLREGCVGAAVEERVLMGVCEAVDDGM